MTIRFNFKVTIKPRHTFVFRKNSKDTKRQVPKESNGLGTIVECLVEFEKNKISLDFCFFSSMEKKEINKKDTNQSYY